MKKTFFEMNPLERSREATMKAMEPFKEEVEIRECNRCHEKQAITEFKEKIIKNKRNGKEYRFRLLQCNNCVRENMRERRRDVRGGVVSVTAYHRPKPIIIPSELDFINYDLLLFP